MKAFSKTCQWNSFLTLFSICAAFVGWRHHLLQVHLCAANPDVVKHEEHSGPQASMTFRILRNVACRHSLPFCWESSVMQGNRSHWGGEIAAAIWRQPQFLPSPSRIRSPAAALWIPCNAFKVSIPCAYSFDKPLHLFLGERGSPLCRYPCVNVAEQRTAAHLFLERAGRRMSAFARCLSVGFERGPNKGRHQSAGVDSSRLSD